MNASLAEGRATPHADLDGLVPRPRLASAFDQAGGTCIGVVVAPSGYGKTTFLQQWAQDDPRPCAWLALRPEHATPVRLLDAITSRMHAVRRAEHRSRSSSTAPRCSPRSRPSCS